MKNGRCCDSGSALMVPSLEKFHRDELHVYLMRDTWTICRLVCVGTTFAHSFSRLTLYMVYIHFIQHTCHAYGVQQRPNVTYVTNKWFLLTNGLLPATGRLVVSSWKWFGSLGAWNRAHVIVKGGLFYTICSKPSGLNVRRYIGWKIIFSQKVKG